MSETYIPPQKTNKEKEIEDNFATINAWQQKDAARRAREVIDTPITPQVDTVKDNTGWSTRAKVTVGFVAGAVLGVGASGAIVADHLLPGQELASASSTVEQGEGIEQSVNRDIAEIESKKIDPANTTERQDVVYQAVKIHSDTAGIVQPGENVTVIAEKSAVFGNVTYKAVPNGEAGNPDTQLPLPPALNTDGTTIPAPFTH